MTMFLDRVPGFGSRGSNLGITFAVLEPLMNTALIGKQIQKDTCFYSTRSDPYLSPFIIEREY